MDFIKNIEVFKAPLFVLLFVLIFHIQGNVSADEGDCNFETTFCKWNNQDNGDGSNWKRGRSIEPHSPERDHTKGDGSYIYNDNLSRDQKGKLEGPFMNSPKCMKFFYYINGDTLTSVQVYIKINGTETLTWVRSGWQLARWTEAQVYFNETKKYQVVLVTTSEGSVEGQTAIDDITFNNGSCLKETDTFYVSANKRNFFKASTSPPADDWQIHFSFTARKTTGNFSDPMYLIYPSHENMTISLKYHRYPLDFFYNWHVVNRSSPVYVMKRSNGIEISPISYLNSRFSSPPKEMITFYAVIGKDKNPGCLVNWIGIGDSCFRFYINTVRTWGSARRRCRRIGGDLAGSESLRRLLNLKDSLHRLFEGLSYPNKDRRIWINDVKDGQDDELQCGELLLDRNKTGFDTCRKKTSFVCQSLRADFAVKRPTNSSAFPKESHFAVDGLPYTCFHAQTKSNFWWSVKLSKMMYVYKVQITNKPHHTKSLPKRNFQIWVLNILKKTDCIFKEVELSNKTTDFECEHPTRGNGVLIYRPALRRLIEKWNEILCHVSVIAFDSVEDIRGVKRKIWYKSFNTQGISSLKEHEMFRSDPDGTTVLKSFSSPFEVNKDHVELLTSYLQVPVSGNYTFHLSCNNECELWIQRYSEGGFLPRTDEKMIISITKWSSYSDEEGLINKSAIPIYVSKCAMYKIEAYVKDEESNFKSTSLSVGMTTPDKYIEYPIRNSRLLSKEPGSRSLVTINQTDYRASFGETIEFKVRCSFCCTGVVCPECPLSLKLRFLSHVFILDPNFKMTGKEKTFQNKTEVTTRPETYIIEIIYSFSEAKPIINHLETGRVDVKKLRLEEDLRLVPSNWKINGWKFKESFSYVNEVYYAKLESRFIKLKHISKTFKQLCLEFEYLMPGSTRSLLEVYAASKGGVSNLLWKLNGIHIEEWKDARSLFNATQDVKFMFVGNTTINNTMTIAVRRVYITNSKYCGTIPTYASPDFCSSEESFLCSNGQECIEASESCDGDDDCSDGSDEKRCKCFQNQFTCLNGSCVDEKDLCNGVKDCTEGGDEIRCDGNCGRRFTCPDSKCILWNSTCSKSKTPLELHCQDGSSSPTICDENHQCPLDKLDCNNIEKTNKKCRYSFRGRCSFEDDFCGLIQNDSFSLQWEQNSGSTLSDRTGPSFDHSSWSNEGNYIFIESSERKPGESAELSSKWMNPDSPICLQFWYHMNGADIGTLSVIIATNYSKKIAWSKSGDQGDQWLFGQVGVFVNGTFRESSGLYPRILSGHLLQGFPRIVRSISMYQLSMSSTLQGDKEMLDFKTEFTIKAETTKKYHGIKRQSGKRNLGEGDIAVDDVVLLEGNCKNIHNSGNLFHQKNNEIFLSKQDIKNKWACLRFWYSIKSKAPRELSIIIRTSAKNSTIWSTKKTTIKMNYVQIPLDKRRDNYNIVFKASPQGDPQEPVVDTDKISLSDVKCQAIPWSPYKGIIQPPGPICSDSLTTSENEINSAKITASAMSWWAAKAKLYHHHCWCSDRGQWLQVDFGNDMKVTKVTTQGGYSSWVENYDLRYKSEEGDWNFYKKNGELFEGNSDLDTPASNYFDPAIIARYVRIYPIEYPSSRSCLKIGYFGCPVRAKQKKFDGHCNDPLGMQSQRIPDASITASSSKVSPRLARLFTLPDEEGNQGWAPAKQDVDPWLQIDFGSLSIVKKVATQRVKEYSISYSKTGKVFRFFYDSNGQRKIWQATAAAGDEILVYRNIKPNIAARYIRIHPIDSVTALTVEFYGCATVNSDIKNIEYLGCYNDPTDPTLEMPSIENIASILHGNYKQRAGAILNCAEAAFERGFDVFALQNNGKCFSGPTPSMLFIENNKSFDCSESGKGGNTEKDVYRIERICPWNNPMCTWKNIENGSRPFEFITKEKISSKVEKARLMENDIPDSSFEALQLSNKDFFISAIKTKTHKALTMCFWIKCGLSGFEISMMKENKSPSIIISQKYHEFTVTILGEDKKTEKHICDQRWHHLCSTWKSQSGTWEIYLDGKLDAFGRSLSRERTIPVINQITIQNAFENTTSQALIITDLNVWQEILPPSEVLRMSYGCGGKGLYGDVVSWENLKKASNSRRLFVFLEDPSCFYEKGALVVNSSTSPNSSDVSVLSQWLNRSATGEGKCMKFRYMIYGPGSRVLKVSQTIPDDEVGENAIWLDDIANTAVWNYGQTSVGSLTRSKISIKGQFLGESSGIMAVGGLHFTDGYCETVPSYANKACDVQLNSSSGIITSPLYPAFYPDNTTCKWTIKVPKEQVIRLTADIFGLETDSRCNKDHVTVYDGLSRDSMIGRYCGRVFPMLESSSNSIMLVFKSNGEIKREGFKIKYEARVDTSCKDLDKCPSNCKCLLSSGKEKHFVVDCMEKELKILPGDIPPQTVVALLASNEIDRIRLRNLKNLKFLKYIDVSKNRMTSITFGPLESINTIKLNVNFVRELKSDTFRHLFSIEVLDLGENLIDKIEPDTFGALRNLRVLSLRSNFIAQINADLFRNNSNLEYLYLQHNVIEKIPEYAFSSLGNLKVLYLNHNKIKTISPYAFEGLHSLEELYLDKNKFTVVTETTFSFLENLKILTLDHFMLCCYAKKSLTSVNFDNCKAPVDEFSSCDDLMKNKAARVSIWILGVLALLGNFCVVVWRLTLSEENRVQSFLLTNLAISDFLMGVYLITIAIKDAQWSEVYFKKDFEWRNGRLCQVTGAISMLSSEVSVLVLTIITAERFKSIVYPMKFRKLSYRGALVVCLVVWVFGLVISCLPITSLDYFIDVEEEMGFYGRSSVCLPLQLSNARLAGWEYAASFFIGLNFAAFMFILFAYIAIMVKVKRSSAKTRSKNTKKETAMAWKVMVIVMTDFCCWMPVIIIGILSLTGDFEDPDGLAYVWIAVFVLPVNSSINPILYTFSNTDVRRKLYKYWQSCRGYDKKDSETKRKTLSNEESQETKRKLKFCAKSAVLNSGKTEGMGYVTCWVKECQHLCLLKYFTPENHADWVNEVKALKECHAGKNDDNVLHYMWHSKVKGLEIDKNNIEIAGIAFTPICSVICFAFSPNCDCLEKFLQESCSTENIENVFTMILDIIKAVEKLHKHGVSHGDITIGNILIEKCGPIPSIKAILGGFDKAKVVKSGMASNKAYKSDVQQVGNLIEDILSRFGCRGQFEELSDITEICSQESSNWGQRMSEIRILFEQVLGDSSEKEKMV